MELVIKKPSYANGVYIAVQLVKKMAYVGESNDIFRRIGEHICSIAGIESEGYGSNSNLVNEEDKRIELFEVYKNANAYKKRGMYAESWTPWIYDETIYMFLMRKYGYKLYNAENDNVGYKRSFLLTDILTSPIVDSEKYNIELSELKEKTIFYLLDLKLKEGKVTENQVLEDIDKCDLMLKEILKDVIGENMSDGVWEFEEQDLEHIWNDKVRKIEKENREKKGKDILSMPYFLIQNQKSAKTYAKELAGIALSKETMELCGIELLSRDKFSEMIQSKKFDTTIFSSFGAYLGQSATTILATKVEDMKRHRLVRNSSGEWEIISENIGDKEKGFCEWSLKKLNETDTRDFFETTNANEKESKYIFLTYTPSKEQAGEINTSRLNPADGERFLKFKERMKNSIINEKKDIIANKIQINWKDKDKKSNLINIPETMFPEIIASGDNRTLLISGLYVLDGYVSDYKKMYEYYWEHSKYRSKDGWEMPVITECCDYHEGNYDKIEEIKEGVHKYRTYKKHQEIISQQQGQKCGRIRGDKEREEFAEMVLSKEFYDESEENRDYRNVIIAELTYPYIATIKE